MLNWIERMNSFVWGPPTLLLIFVAGVFLSLKTGFAQFRLLPAALSGLVERIKCRNHSSGTSSYRALCTALAATVGTGNIAGVAGAIAIGGPGAIFWMWICAFLGMIVKFAEAALSVAFRKKNSSGEFVGGPMYMIETTLPRGKWLAYMYCFFGAVASFGVGNSTQVNAVIGGVHSVLEFLGRSTSRWMDILIGIVIAFLILRMMLGGAKKIGAVVERLVPFAAVGYIILCVIAIGGCYQNIPKALKMILYGAFDPSAICGGAVGSAVIALRAGVSRGIFTNEAGLGTAGIAHASADVDHPVEQGLMGIVEVFLDTIVICTMTALVILCSGISIGYGNDTGILLTLEAFSAVIGDWIAIPITLALICFAIATIFGWGLYGIRCVQFLFGGNSWRPFVYLQAVVAVIGAVMGTGIIWTMAEIVNGLMAVPNLIVLVYLAPELKKLLDTFGLDNRSKRIH